MNDPITHVKLPIEVYRQLAAYLSGQPYGAVAELVMMIESNAVAVFEAPSDEDGDGPSPAGDDSDEGASIPDND